LSKVYCQQILVRGERGSERFVGKRDEMGGEEEDEEGQDGKRKTRDGKQDAKAGRSGTEGACRERQDEELLRLSWDEVRKDKQS